MPTRIEVARAAHALRFIAGGAGWAPILDAADYVSRTSLVRVAVHPLPRALQAVLWSDRPSGPLIVVNARVPRRYRNFAVAHELGHWKLHADVRPGDADRFRRRRMEWEANQFAIEFLLPAPLLLRVRAEARKGLDETAQRLGVSGSMLRRCLRELDGLRS